MYRLIRSIFSSRRASTAAAPLAQGTSDGVASVHPDRVASANDREWSPAEQLQRAVNRVSHSQLAPITLGLAGLYILFALAHLFTMPATIARIMTPTAALTAAAAVVLWMYMRRVCPESNKVHWITAGITVFVLINSLLHLYLSGEPRQSTNILLVVVATGYLILSTRFFVGVLALSLLAWIMTAAALPPSDEWVHYGFGVFQATLISIVIHILRVRTTRRAELMRLREAWRGDALEEAKERAEEMARLKSAFLANMSHEIRTPLTGILGFAEIMEEEAEANMKRIAGIIRQNGQRLLETINSVLDLARLESGKMTMDAEHVNVAEAVEPVIELFRPLADKQNLWLDLQVDEPDAVVAIDPSWLLRIQSNLIGNALKFTESGGATVVVSGTEDAVAFTVKDTGVGIAEEFLPHLYEEFRQESTGIARAHEGSGLGLAITQRLVDLAGGRIDVESRKGNGSAFTVTMPRVDKLVSTERAGEVEAARYA